MQATSHPFTKVDAKQDKYLCAHIEPWHAYSSYTGFTQTRVSLRRYRDPAFVLIGPHASDTRILFFREVVWGQCESCNRVYWGECVEHALPLWDERSPVVAPKVHLKAGRKLHADMAGEPILFTDPRQHALIGMARAVVEKVAGIKAIAFTDWENKCLAIPELASGMGFDTVEMRVEAEWGQFVQIEWDMEQVERTPQTAATYAVVTIERHFLEEHIAGREE